MRKKGMRIAVALAAVASLALVVPASGGQAVKSKLTIKKIGATGAKGKLTSKERACKKRRKVALRYQGEYTWVEIGRTKTNKRGRWKVKTEVEDRGVFFAVAKPVKRGGVKCKRARSKPVRFR